MPVSRNAVSGNSAPVSDNSIPKLDRKYTHIVNNDASVGLNGVPGQHEVSDTTRGNAFLEGMSNVFNTVGNAVGQGVNKLKQALVSSGNASWFGGEEQKAAAEQALREEEAANREAINEYRDYRNTLKEEHPIAYGAGDFLTKSQLYRGAGGLGAATGAEAALSGKIGETGANLALGQAADVLLDTIPTEIENYQNGMSGKDIAIDTAKNLGTNALFNLGAEGLQTLPGLLKNAANNWTADQLARQEVENAIKETSDVAKSAPIPELENVVKETPEIPAIREELNPLGMATNDAELEALAAQRQSAVDAIDGLREQIPAQPVTNNQTAETLTNAVKPENGANRSVLQELTDDIINTRNTQDLVGNGYSEAGQAYRKNIDRLMKQETNLLEQAEKSNDPAVRQLYDEVAKTGEDYWNNVTQVNTPINPDLINTHRQALENLDNYMKNMPENYGDTIRRSVKELEMPKETRKEITNRLKGMESYADRINNAATREELRSIVSDAEKMAGDTEALLKQSAGIREIKKGDFDPLTKSFAESLNGRKIYLSPEVRANFPGMTINDFNNSLYFSGNGGRFKPKFTSTPGEGVLAIDQAFSGIDEANGYALSSFMKDNNLNSANGSDQLRGLLDYGEYLKSNKDSMKLRPYEGGMFEDFLANVRKTADDKLNTFKEAVTPEPLLKPNLQFFAEQADDLEKQIEGMADGAEKEQLKGALNDFREALNNGATPEEAEKAWNAISKTRNTMKKSGFYTAEEMATQLPESDARYIREHMEVPVEDARNFLDSQPEYALERYTQTFKNDNEAGKELANSRDISGMHLLSRDLVEKARAAETPEERQQLYAQARKVMSNLYVANREAGRAGNVNKYFSGDPTWVIENAQGFAENKVEKALSKETNLKNGIKGVSEQITNFLQDMDKDALSRKDIEDMIDYALAQHKEVKKRIGKNDVKKIADAILNEKQYVDIQKQLEFLATGYKDLDKETVEQIQNIFEKAQKLNYNSKERVELENEGYKLLASKIAPNGGTFRDKFDAWRYLAMLGNPLTHIKNKVGNFIFGKGMVSAKNNMAALIEAAADRVSKGGIERTKAILNPAKDGALIEAAKADGLENAFRELSGNKYFDVGQSIDNAIAPFSNKNAIGRLLNKANDLNSGKLNAADEEAMMSKYATSLAGFLKANGADESIFKATDKNSLELLESARAYAINQGQEAAFHQNSATANWLSQISNTAKNSDSKVVKGLGLGLDVTIPFKKTPMNILKSGFAYSPFELIKVAGDVVQLKKGNIKPTQLIDDISKMATGTIAFGIGALLAHEGIFEVGTNASDEELSFGKNIGRQGSSFKVLGRYIPIQELMPSSAPIILGATTYETFKNKDNGNGEEALNTIFSGMSAIANNVTDMTMLSGVADTLSSIGYAEDKSEVWQNLGLKVASNLAGQVLPTVGRKINTTLDDTKRSTYSDKSGAAKVIDQEVKFLQTKIPGLQQAGEKLKESDIPALQKAGERLALEPNIDVKGQVQESPGFAGFNNFAGRVVNNFISPLAVTKDTGTKYDDERIRLARETGKNNVLPHISSSEAKINDEKLSPKDWTEYRKTRGQLNEKIAEGVIDSADYKKMSDVDKAGVLSKVDSFTKAYSQSKFGKEMESGDKKLAAIYEESGVKGVTDYLTYKTYLDGYEHKDIDSKLKSVRKMSKEQQKALLPEILTKTEKERFDSVKGDVDRYWKSYDKDQKAATAKEAEKQQTIKNAGVTSVEDIQKELASYGAEDSPTTVEFYARAKKEISSLTPKIYSQYLKSIGGNNMKINQDELIFYANRNKLSEKEINTYWKAFGNDWKQIPKLDKNGNWTAGKASKKKK